MVLCEGKEWRSVLDRKADLHIKMLIPGGRKSALYCVCSICLVPIHRDDSKWVREAKDLALEEGIGGENCERMGQILQKQYQSVDNYP